MAPYFATDRPEQEMHFRAAGGAMVICPVLIDGPRCKWHSALFSVHCSVIVYNKFQLSLTHKQLKVGIANQRHPLTSSESSQHNPKKQE